MILYLYLYVYVYVYIYIYIWVFDFVYRFSHLSSLFPLLSISLTFVHFLFICLFVMLHVSKQKESLEANTIPQPIEQRLQKIWRYTRYVCLFFASLLYCYYITYNMLINHLLTSLFLLFHILLFYYNLPAVGRGRCTRRLFYKCRGKLYSKSIGTVL